jgi:nucleoside-diphosphate-sugar epimerase
VQTEHCLLNIVHYMTIVHDKPTVALFGGSGTIGQAVAPLFAPRSFRVVGRSLNQLQSAFAAYPGADLAVWDQANPQTAEAALQGIQTLVYLVGVSYTDFRLHPILFDQVLTAAIKAGVQRCVLVGTVYPFGFAQTSLIREDHPRNPHTFKGQMRKQQEDLLLAASLCAAIPLCVFVASCEI